MRTHIREFNFTLYYTIACEKNTETSHIVAYVYPGALAGLIKVRADTDVDTRYDALST